MKKSLFKNKSKHKSCGGAIIEESAIALFVLFILLFFPLLDLLALGVRCFFVWYACEESAIAGAKATRWTAGNSAAGAVPYFTSIQTQATTTLTSTINSFTGITVTNGTKFRSNCRSLARR